MKNSITPEEKRRQMTEMPVNRLIVKLAVPTIISMLVTSFYNMADTFFVGQLNNTSATGAVGVVYPFMAIIQALGFMFGQGSGNAMSRRLGRDDREGAERVGSTAFFLALITGGALTVIGLLALHPLMRLLGATQTILPYAMDYGRYILLGAPFMVASYVLNNQLRFQGSAMFSMIGIMSGSILNILLDPLFIFSFNMGVTGAAVATAISQFVGFCVLYWGVCQEGNIRPKIRLFRPNGDNLFTIFKGGLPSLCRQGLGSVASVMLNSAAGAAAVYAVYGDAAITAMTIVNRVMMFAASTVIGFGQGFQPVCGYNYGAKKYPRVLAAYRFSVGVVFCAMLVFAAAGVAFSSVLVRVFSKDPVVIDFAILALRLQLCVFPCMSVVFMSNMMLQTIGAAFRASVLSMARQGLFFIPAILIMPRVLGPFGIQLSQPISDVLSMALTILLTLPVIRELKKADIEGRTANL